MALINHAKREINAKIVYYGREGVGKRVSLQYLYDRIKPSLRGELKTIPASGDSLLFFDFSPFEHPVLGGYRIRFHMYSLTGRVTNPAAWKMTLKNADGIVIVADDSPESVSATRQSISSLRGFLAAYGVGLHDIPCVLQLNGADSHGRSLEAGIAAELDVPDMRTCISESGGGKGVLEALSLISRDIMTRIGQDDALQSGGHKISSEVRRDADEPPSLTPLESEERLMPPEPVQSIEEVSSLRAERQEEGENGCEHLQVSVVGEGVVCAEGAVRIPLEITLAGVSRRLIVSIAIEQE